MPRLALSAAALSPLSEPESTARWRSSEPDPIVARRRRHLWHRSVWHRSNADSRAVCAASAEPALDFFLSLGDLSYVRDRPPGAVVPAGEG
jgi:hypothetical protein